MLYGTPIGKISKVCCFSDFEGYLKHEKSGSINFRFLTLVAGEGLFLALLIRVRIFAYWQTGILKSA